MGCLSTPFGFPDFDPAAMDVELACVLAFNSAAPDMVALGFDDGVEFPVLLDFLRMDLGPDAETFLFFEGAELWLSCLWALDFGKAAVEGRFMIYGIR